MAREIIMDKIKKKVEKIYLEKKEKKNQTCSCNEDLREVMFKVCEYEFNPDLTEEERRIQEDETRERNGFFHKWISVERRSAESGNFINVTCALIEDAETGKMYQVESHMMNFLH